MMTTTVEDVRNDMPVLERCLHMHSASLSPCPMPVIRAMSDYQQTTPVNYGERASRMGREVTRRGDQIRRNIAEFVGATSATEIVFTKNTTEAINIVATGLDWGPGDEVIVSALEHQSNVIPWMRLAAEHGGSLRVVQPNGKGLVEPQDIRQAITSKTRIVCLSHIANTVGTIQPVEEVGAIAREHGLLYLVDAAQSLGRIPADVKRIGCDFMACCGRKALMGPSGTGFLYGRADALRALRPMIVGSPGANMSTSSSFSYVDLPRKLEAGVPNTVGIVGLGRAVEYIQGIGTEVIAARLRELSQLLRSGLEDLNHVDLYGTRRTESQSGIISWNVRGVDCQEVAAVLDERAGAVVGAGTLGSPLAMHLLETEGVVRTSLHFYNTEEEVRKLLQAVASIRSSR